MWDVRSRLAICFSFVAFHAVAANAGQFSLALEAKPLTPGEIQAASLLLSKVDSLLPSSIKDGIGREVHVAFTDFGSPAAFLPDCASSGADHSSSTQKSFQLGSTHGRNGILINRLLLPEVLKGPSGSKPLSCSHRNYHDQALGALIHELIHLYDSQNIQSTDLRRKIEQCKDEFQSYGSETEECRQLKFRTTTVSTDPLYLDTAGWIDTGFAVMTRSYTNQNHARSPDPYELTDPQEHFAVNAEFFFLDPEYACRRPSLQRYFVKQFGVDPFPARNCSVARKVLMYSSSSEGNAATLVDIPLDRLYAVQFLLAGRGQAAMSRFGHAMYRLVICAPERKTVGPECLLDFQYHLVVSFRAAQADLIMSPIDGMFGKYPTRLYILPLLEVIDEYAVMEFREVKALTLNLTPEQRAQFVDRVVETEHTYRSRYYFLENNCQTESMNLLRGAVDSDLLRSLQPRSPLGFYKDLVRTGFGKMPAQGSYFAPKRESLLNAFARISPNLGSTSLHSLDDYLTNTTAQERREYFNAASSIARPADIRALAAGFYVLESFIQKRLNTAIGVKIMSLALDGNSGKLNDFAQAEELKALLKRFEALTLESGIPDGAAGYGIPLETEFSAASTSSYLSSASREIRELFDRIQALAASAVAKQLSEMDAIQDNQRFFVQEMRKNM